MKKVLLSAPILTRSGYGEHARFVFQSLKTNPDIDLYVMPLNWGQSNWVYEDTEERLEIDGYIQKAAQSDGNFDISIQVTIPNEWVNAAPINVGVCAGIETDKVSMAWLKKANEMDKVIFDEICKAADASIPRIAGSRATPGASCASPPCKPPAVGPPITSGPGWPVRACFGLPAHGQRRSSRLSGR